jgi:hypothetical protein
VPQALAALVAAPAPKLVALKNAVLVLPKSVALAVPKSVVLVARKNVALAVPRNAVLAVHVVPKNKTLTRVLHQPRALLSAHAIAAAPPQ